MYIVYINNFKIMTIKYTLKIVGQKKKKNFPISID